MNINSLGTTSPAIPVPELQATDHAQAVAQTRQVAKAVKSLNESPTIPDDREFSLSIDPSTRMPVVRFVDTATNTVIEQIPAEYVLKLAAFMEAETEQNRSFKSFAG